MEVEPLENSDLLKGKTERNGNSCHAEDTTNSEPPDGGFRAYAVVFASFLTNGLIFGVINSYSVIYKVLQEQLTMDGVTNSETRASLVGALTMGTTFFLSPLSGVLTGLMGLRLTAVLGGIIASSGLLMSSFVIHNVDALNFTYGIMYGIGASFAYTPSLAILGHYFKRYLGVVNGLVAIGSSVFTVFMPPLMEHIIKKYGLDWLFRILAVFTFCIALCGFLFKPIALVKVKKPREYDSCISFLSTVFNVEIWRKRKYKFWALSMPVALFGYLVPYVHIRTFMENKFDNVNYNLPLQCLAITSGLGRITFGFLADRPRIDRILLQQISFYGIGTITIILPFVTSFPLLVMISLLMGIFDGAFIALIGPIAFELCGSEFAAQGIGCMLGLAAPPLCIGPPVAGRLYRDTGSYKLPFVLAGISPVIGATLMFATRFRCPPQTPATSNGHIIAMAGVDEKKSPGALLKINGTVNQESL